MTNKILIDRSVLEQALYALWGTAAEEGSEAYERELEAIKALRAAMKQTQSPSCVACEDHPAPGNNPCAVCGKEMQPQVGHKPIAWANINKQGDITHTINKKMAWAKTPLYTHPQPPRQPLDEETIYDIWDLKFRGWIGGEQFEVVVKAIERAHGIEEE